MSETQLLVGEASFHNFLESGQILLGDDFRLGIKIPSRHTPINLENQLRNRPEPLQVWLLSQRTIQIASRDEI